jgi:tetratricopeptide (TPR) repeat protein
LRLEQQDEAALKLFRQAQELSPSARGLAQIGLVEQALGHWVSAEEHLQQALASREDAWITQHHQALEDALESVQKHLASVQVLANVDGAEVWVNGVLRGRTPLSAVRVPAATTVIEVRAPGFIPASLKRNPEAGELVRESVTLVAFANDGRAAAKQPNGVSPREDLREPEPSAGPVPWIVGGAGVAALGVTGLLAILARSEVADLPENCRENPNRFCSPDEGARVNQARDYARVANVTGAVGLAAVATSALLFLKPQAKPRNARPRVSGSVETQGAAVIVSGGF